MSTDFNTPKIAEKAALKGLGYYGSDGAVTCAQCDFEMEWETCSHCEDGYVDRYEEDPTYYDPGDLYPCDMCRGRGGVYHCDNPDCSTIEAIKIVNAEDITLCTEAKPNKEARIHPHAKAYGDDVDVDRYHCPHCDVRFKVEVPE